MTFGLVLVVGTLLLTVVSAGFAEDANRIEDNSFLIEEAYNQEPGIIQHIQSFQYTKSKQWAYTFTQEWPVPGRAHQLSYTVPLYRLNEEGGRTGLGDVQVNYRYQLIDREDFLAMAPRLSLLLPTGDHRKGFGRGNPGFQTNVPVSLTLSDKWVTHWNAGLTFTRNAKGEDGRKGDTLDANAGASVVYLLHQNFNLLLEMAWNANQSVDGKREHTLLINPGMRAATNFTSGLQMVSGIGVPIGVGPSAGEYGIFLYLSLEHPFTALYGKGAMKYAPSFNTRREEQ